MTLGPRFHGRTAAGTEEGLSPSPGSVPAGQRPHSGVFLSAHLLPGWAAISRQGEPHSRLDKPPSLPLPQLHHVFPGLSTFVPTLQPWPEDMASLGGRRRGQREGTDWSASSGQEASLSAPKPRKSCGLAGLGPFLAGLLL